MQSEETICVSSPSATKDQSIPQVLQVEPAPQMSLSSSFHSPTKSKFSLPSDAKLSKLRDDLFTADKIWVKKNCEWLEMCAFSRAALRNRSHVFLVLVLQLGKGKQLEHEVLIKTTTVSRLTDAQCVETLCR